MCRFLEPETNQQTQGCFEMKTTKRPRVAVIGVGNMGKNHLRVYSEIPSVKVVAIADTNLHLARNLASNYQIDAYCDYQVMLKQETIDIVSICVPTSSHYEIAKSCMGYGAHVLLEKPITESVEHAHELLEFSKKQSTKLMVGHVERFNPVVNKIKELVRQGEVGKIIAIIARRVGKFPPPRQDVDVATDLAIHDIDVCNYLLGELPIDVRKNEQRNKSEYRNDSVEFFLKYGSGASSYIQANWVTPVKIRKLVITGDGGYLEADYISQEVEFYQTQLNGETHVVKIVFDKKEPLKEQLLHFINSVVNDIVVDSTFALDSLRIALNQ